MLRYLAAGLAMASIVSFLPAYAHFLGATKEVDRFQIVFQPYPQTPIINTNSTLNFSVLKDGYNINNIYSAVTMVSKKDGHVIFQDPYRFYELSDITVPYRFNQTGDYVLTLQTRITGDPKYQSQPLEASVDISAFPPGIPLDELMLYYVTPAAAAIAGIAIYMRSRGKL